MKRNDKESKIFLPEKKCLKRLKKIKTSQKSLPKNKSQNERAKVKLKRNIF